MAKTVIWTNDNRIAWLLLTTPIAYISSIPYDPFSNTTADLGADSRIRSHYVFNTNANPNERFGGLGLMREMGYIWYMYSPGPGLTESVAPWPDHLLAATHPNNSSYHPTDRIYTSSNGVKSEGWIVNSNKGFYPDF